MTNKSPENTILAGVESALRSLPGLTIRSIHRESRDAPVDLDVELEVKGRPARVLVEAKSHGYPRDARDAIWQLMRARGSESRDPVVCFFAAPAISPGGRRLLRDQGIGYWDEGGSLYLELPWALYLVDREMPPDRERRPRQSYRGSKAQALHALLIEPDRPWRVRDLAERSEVSPYTAHQVFVFLEDHLWVEKEGAGPNTIRTLREPGALLDAWAEARSLGDYEFHRFYRWTQSPSVLRRVVAGSLDRLGTEYALTFAAGAELVAPYATDPATLSVIVSSTVNVDEIARALELKRVEEGENVTLLSTRERSPLLFRQRIDDVWVASPVQLYLDLWAWPARGRDQAKHLRIERLAY